MLTLREFVEDHHFIFASKEYSDSRFYLKNCGKPKDWYDIWLIKFHKETCKIFQGYK